VLAFRDPQGGCGMDGGHHGGQVGWYHLARCLPRRGCNSSSLNPRAEAVVMPCFMERVAPVVDETIRALAKTKFVEDLVAGVKYSRSTSIVSSAYKRHGRILETALRESLRDSNRHRVWQEDVFRVSRAADALVGSQNEDACRQSALPYGEVIRTLQVDMVAFDEADQTIRAYEVKRGNGQFDAGKIRSIKRDLMCVQVLLRSYGEELAKLKPAAAESKIIFYYGVRSLPRPWSLVKSELDAHFGFPVVERIEEANAYFQDKLFRLLDAP
jgi:hypothetical protein